MTAESPIRVNVEHAWSDPEKVRVAREGQTMTDVYAFTGDRLNFQGNPVLFDRSIQSVAAMSP